MGNFKNWVFLALSILFNLATGGPVINTLPGYSGTLPFKLETGYVGLGERDEIQLFYYFIESETDPDKDPLLLWLPGGPGCSSFSGLVYEIGPLMFDFQAFDGSSPKFLLNPYSWTKIANIIFLDSPVGTGFSYSTTSEGYYSSDTKSSKDIHSFLKKWLFDHPNFVKNPLYIAGDSYSGMIVPLVIQEISNGNDAEQTPHISLKGYILGNPFTDYSKDVNSRIPFAHRVGLISDKYYKSAKRYCNSDYVNPDQRTDLCAHYLRRIEECTSKVYMLCILEPNCDKDAANEHEEVRLKPLRRSLRGNVLALSKHRKLWCRFQNMLLSVVWMNDPSVQEALGIRNGTITTWSRCNKTLSYVRDLTSVIQYHQLISTKAYRALIYSGDHDMAVPYISTLEWIRKLNLSMQEDWRPWFVQGQVAGYTEKYMSKSFSLTFATVKGGGHTAPEYKPEECLAMIDRWLSYYQL